MTTISELPGMEIREDGKYYYCLICKREIPHGHGWRHVRSVRHQLNDEHRKEVYDARIEGLREGLREAAKLSCHFCSSIGFPELDDDGEYRHPMEKGSRLACSEYKTYERIAELADAGAMTKEPAE